MASRWFRSMTARSGSSRKSTRPRGRRPEPPRDAVRPRLEALEDRTLPSFAAGINLATDAAPMGVATGDFNGDGNPDLVSANSGASTISVMLGNGDGSFKSAVNYATPNKALAVGVGDLDRDGRLDIAAVSHGFDGTSTLNIFLGNSDGIFHAGPASYSVAVSATAMAVSDLNGDGIPDIAISGSGVVAGVTVRLANGDGTFRPEIVYGTSGFGPTGVVASDFSGDAKPDLVVTDANSATTLLLNSGTGLFSSGPKITGANDALAVAAGDVNKDGRADLIVVNNFSNDVSVLLGTGSGMFGSASKFATGNSPHGVVVADLDGDGNPDLAVANQTSFSFGIDLNTNSVSVLLGNGNGLFKAAANYGAGQLPTAVLTADFNKDGKFDLAVADDQTPGNVSVLLGRGNGGLVEAANYAAGTGPAAVTVADLNSDGRPDLAVLLPSSDPSSNNVSVLLATAAGGFLPGVNYPVQSSPSAIGAGDFNGDGKIDLAVTNASSNTVSVLRNNGNGTFLSALNFPVGSNPVSVVVADFSGDGRLDLAVANGSSDNVSILLGAGDATFQSAANYAVARGPSSIARGDFNGDGKLDLAVVTRSTLSVLVNDGNGIFQPSIDTPTPLFSAGIAVGDFDGDGRADVAITNTFDNSVDVLLGNGNGMFKTAKTFPTDGDPVAVVVADFNGDGKLDLATANKNNLDVTVLQGNGDGTFAPRVGYLARANPAGLAVADIDGNSTPDLVVANNGSNNVSVLLNNVSASTQLSVTAPASTVAGVSFSVTVRVTGAALYLGTVHFSSSDPQGQPPPNYTFTAADNGVHTFSVILKTAGTQTITVTDTAAGTIRGSASVAVSAAAAASLVLTAPSSSGAGTGFSVTLTAKDLFGNIATGYGGMVHFTSSDGRATLPLTNYTFTSFDAGRHTFSNLVLRTVGTQTVTVADTSGTPPGVTLSIKVSASGLIVTGADAGGGPEVKVYDALTLALKFDFYAYNIAFSGGVRVTTGDVNRDGIPDIITAPGPSGGPDVRVFSGVDGQLIQEFFAYAPAFTGGIFIASGDVNGDGFADIITGADAGGGPHVQVWNGINDAVLDSFFPYALGFRGGVRVAAGDVNGDGLADIITSPGATGGPDIRVFDGANIFNMLREIIAYNPAFTGGVYVAAGDTDGDGKADIITGAGASGGPHVKVFGGKDGALLQSFLAYAPGFTGGVRVGFVSDLNGDGKSDILVAAGPGGGPHVQVFDGINLAILDSFFAYDGHFPGGVYVGGA